MKKPFIIVAVVVVVLLVIILALPYLIDVNQFKPKLQSDLGEALGRKVEVGNISLAIFSGGVALDNISISDDPAFSRTPFLTAKQLTVGVNLLPLIFSKKLEVRSFSIVDPEVSLWKNSAGVWNYSSMGAAGAKSKPQPGTSPKSSSKSDDPAAGTDLSVEKLTVSDGKISVGTVGSRAKPLVYQEVNLEASDLSTTSQFPFKLSAKDPSNGALKVEGKAGPINQSDASLTPLDAKIDVQHLDLGASTGFLSPSSGIAGLVDFNGTLTSDGHEMSSKGMVKTSKLKLVANGAPSHVPVNVDYSTAYNLKRQIGELKQGDIRIGKALARLTGSYNMAGEETAIQMKLNGQGMSVPDLEGALPAVGVTLPSGATLESGTLDANLAISGPVSRLLITGPVNLSNGKLAGFSLKSKLGALSSFTGLGGGGGGNETVIQTLSMNFRMDTEGTHGQNLSLVVPTIGTITGDANISPSGELNCKMVANLAGAAGQAGQVVTGLGGLGGLAGGGSKGGGIPFMIKGTTSNPIFVPDIGGMAKGMAEGGAAKALGGTKGTATEQAAGALGGLLGKKKK